MNNDKTVVPFNGTPVNTGARAETAAEKIRREEREKVEAREARRAEARKRHKELAGNPYGRPGPTVFDRDRNRDMR